MLDGSGAGALLDATVPLRTRYVCQDLEDIALDVYARALCVPGV